MNFKNTVDCMGGGNNYSNGGWGGEREKKRKAIKKTAKNLFSLNFSLEPNNKSLT